jgi:DNA-binding CsgD family transcriptional regulator
MAAAWLVLRKLQVVASPLAEIERVLGAFVDRVADVAPMDQLGLSKREQEVLEVMRRGAITDAEIAAELHIASETARSHVKSIFRKTGLADRRDLVVLALRSA